ncbi:MAG: CoA transferase [Acidimicrobiaceae bacterium]|nr:CoA transferase [Acidimicrobiaceae bacterium]MYD08376.1 CoA transferase [Acidimicrobiaceae bacterium]MYI58859.1 CoA transferase [Acidimicrobiaceae bacterium]
MSTGDEDIVTTVGALGGVRVLDFASVGPGARASRILSDYGAEVIKLGPVPADRTIQITPPHYAYSGHRLMKRALLDLKSDDGRDAFLALAEGADVVLESFRPGVVDRLGIGYGAVKNVNDRIIYCSTSGFGQSGPRSHWAGHDINYLALSGYLDCTGRRADGSPPLPGATVADIAAGGMHAAMAIMAALLRRAQTNFGEYLDVSIADGAFGLMSLYVDEYLATGTEPSPGHYILTGRFACYDVYTCGDGRHLSIGAIEPQFWRNLCTELGLEKYADSQTDDDVQDEVRMAISKVLATKTRDQWAAQLGPADCCVTAVNTVAEAVEDEQYIARGLVVEADHVTEGRFRQTGPVWSGTTQVDGAYPVRDSSLTDTAELLATAGYADTLISELVTKGAIA